MEEMVEEEVMLLLLQVKGLDLSSFSIISFNSFLISIVETSIP